MSKKEKPSLLNPRLSKLPSLDIKPTIYANDETIREVYRGWYSSLIKLRERAASSLLILYAFMVVCTLTIYFFQGFHLWGFNLSQRSLDWLGIATIGEIGGFIAAILSSIFRKN